MGPRIDYLVVSFVIGDESHIIVFHYLIDLGVTLTNEIFFFRWNDDVFQIE